jgi:hypothetical protein
MSNKNNLLQTRIFNYINYVPEYSSTHVNEYIYVINTQECTTYQKRALFINVFTFLNSSH